VKQRHGFAIFFRVFEFAVNGRYAARQRGFELGKIADQDDQLRIRSSRREEALINFGFRLSAFGF
jgi:hypothetical protein